MTTAGRVVGSMRKRDEGDETQVEKMKKDLRGRSNKGFKGEVHGREVRFEKRKKEGELVMAMKGDLDPK